jgi:chromate transporter
MVLLAALYQGAHELAAVVSMFKGLQVIVVALVANATFNFGRGTIKIWQDIALGLGVTVFLVLHGNPIFAIMASALLGGLLLYRKIAFKLKEAVTPSPDVSLRDFKIPFLLTAALLVGMLLLFLVDRQLFDLSVVMAKVDFFAFGGGYGSVPLMFNEVVSTRHWLDGKVFMDGIALGQVTPGPIVITATFVGYLLAWLPGAMVGTVAIFAPSLIFLTAVIPCFDRLQGNLLFQRMMHGVLVSFIGLLLSVTLRFILAISWDLYQFVIVILALAALRFKIDILWVVLVGSVLSVLLL